MSTRDKAHVSFWEGTKIRLRALEPADASFFFELQKDTERNRLLDFLPPPQSFVSVDEWVQEKAKQSLEDDAFQWLIETIEGEPVGSIVTHTCNSRDGTFSYALDIAREHRRQGYAKEAIAIVLRYYFEELRYQKVNVTTQSNNEPTVALHKSFGFKHEGTQRRMVFQQGRYFDLLLFGLTKEEFDRNPR